MLDLWNYELHSIFFYYAFSELIHGGLSANFLCIYGVLWLVSMENSASNKLPFVVNTWSKSRHFSAISLILILSFISALLLQLFSDAAFPFLDALVTWGAVVATYMVAKKLLENWIYWLVIDSISIVLFISRDLWPTAFLFSIYIVIIIIGYRSWRETLQEKMQSVLERIKSIPGRFILKEELSSNLITKIYLCLLMILNQL